MNRVFFISFFFPVFLQAQTTINSTGQPATVTINKPGQSSTVTINIGTPVEGPAMYSLTGSNEITATSSTLDFNYTEPQSYETWFKLDNVGDGVKTLLSMYNEGTTKGTRITVGTDKYIYFYSRNGSEILEVKSLAAVSNYILQILIKERWYHLIITHAGTGASGIKFYVDGQIIQTTTVNNTLASNPENSSTIHFGTSTALDISTTRAFSKVLSAAEVTTLYNEGQPLLAHGISNEAFDLNITGPSATMNLLIRNGNQNFVGGKLYYNTYGLAGDSRTLLTNSPFTDQRTCIYYDASNNRSYISWQQRPYLGGNRQGMIMYIDHTIGYASPSYPIGYHSPGGHDGHGQPECIVTPDNQILVISEDQHLSPIYARKTTGKDITNITEVSSYSTVNHSYPAFGRIGGDLYVLTRGGTGSFLMRDYITKTTNSGSTWGTPAWLLNLDNGTGTDRAYFNIIYSENKLQYFIKTREDSEGIFKDIYYLESTDGTTFRNVNNTWSKAITSGHITRAELEANCHVISSSTHILLKEAIMRPSGPAGFTNHITDNYQYVYWNGTGWDTKPLPLPVYEPNGAEGNTGRIDYWGCYAYSDEHQVLWRIETRGGYDVVVQYETFDEWDTWDAGIVVSDVDKKHEQLQITYNKSSAKIIVAANQLESTSEDNNIFLYEYTPVLE